ncbi:MAG: hypothetical protein J7465_15930 [Chloroflexus sp.]|nr:hypothetical protein [Chloroflexus sp.]
MTPTMWRRIPNSSGAGAMPPWATGDAGCRRAIPPWAMPDADGQCHRGRRAMNGKRMVGAKNFSPLPSRSAIPSVRWPG